MPFHRPENLFHGVFQTRRCPMSKGLENKKLLDTLYLFFVIAEIWHYYLIDLFGIYSALGIITWCVPSLGLVEHPDKHLHKVFQEL